MWYHNWIWKEVLRNGHVFLWCSYCGVSSYDMYRSRRVCGWISRWMATFITSHSCYGDVGGLGGPRLRAPGLQRVRHVSAARRTHPPPQNKPPPEANSLHYYLKLIAGAFERPTFPQTTLFPSARWYFGQIKSNYIDSTVDHLFAFPRFDLD